MQNGIRITHPPEQARVVAQALAELDTIDTERGMPAVPIDAVLAWLAAGRFERVRRLLLHATPAATLPLAAARYVAWTGDLRTAAAIWQPVRDATIELLRSTDAETAGSDESRLRMLTYIELQRAATDVGDPSLAATLHRAASSSPVGQATLMHVDADSGAAAAVLGFVHGVLGIEPDATRHRLRMRPLMREHVELAAEQIRFGDGSVALSGTRTADDGTARYAFRVVQDAGAVPLTVLLEPIVRGSVSAAYVDDRPAELTPRPHDGGTLVPVQLVLDEERGLRVETRDG